MREVEGTGRRQPLINVPNTITLLRILCVPVFLSLVSQGDYSLGVLVFVAAGLSDGLDGTIARLTDSRTELGAHLDPAADKLLLVSTYIALGILGAIPLQLMIVVIVRDVVILGGFFMSGALVGRYMAMAPSVWGKATTCAQILTAIAVLLEKAKWVPIGASTLSTMFVVTAVASTVSGVDYVLRGIRWYQANTASSA
jgi:cardiolipin synthase (CMP-forming)